MDGIWDILRTMNYYFITYIYIWIPCIIAAFILGWWWDKTHEKFEAQKQHKYIIRIRKKEGMTITKRIITNLKEFYFYEGLIGAQSQQRPELTRPAYHITPDCTFEIFKEGWEPLYNNWFTNRLLLRLIYKHKGWNWYKKFITHFEEGQESTIQEGLNMKSGIPFEINVGNKKQLITAVDIKILIETNFVESAVNELYRRALTLTGKKKWLAIIVVASILGIIVYMIINGWYKV